MASFFAQQLDLLSLTSPPTFDRRGQSRAVREAIFSASVSRRCNGDDGRTGLIRKAVYTMRDL